MSIGDRIKQRRIDLELTADDLAHRVGKSRATIYRYENGDIENMPTTVLEPLADALYTTPAYLMGWTNDPHNWEQIGNDHGIYPPKDYEGSYAEYVKFKMYEDQDSLIDSYYDAHPEQDINEPFRDEFSPEVRAAARGMMELSPEDQKTAIDMINYLSQKGREAKKD
jgi:Predicted transcriptional regulators